MKGGQAPIAIENSVYHGESFARGEYRTGSDLQREDSNLVKSKAGAAGRIRTHDLRLRRPSLYPAELLPHTYTLDLHHLLERSWR